MQNNRVCKICGRSYYYCYSCDEAQRGKTGFEPWHILVHDNNCRVIFDTLQRYFTKEYSKGQARKILKSCDLSAADSADERTKKQIEEIMIEPEPKQRSKRNTQKVIEN